MATGVALVVAGVVVANPIIAPRSDVTIPTIALSAGIDDTTGMLDDAFLNAIAPTPPESTSPFAVLRQLITELAADVSYFGRTALVEAFVAGVAAVAQPELTASSYPYVGYPDAGVAANRPTLAGPPAAAAANPAPAAAAANPGPEAPANPAIPAVTPVDPALVILSLLPAAQHAVAALAADAHYVRGELVAAAFATGALVSTEPELIAATLRALVAGDVESALASAVKAVAAPLGPPAMILEALRTVVHSHLDRWRAPAAPPQGQVEPAALTALRPTPGAALAANPPAAGQRPNRPSRPGAVSLPADRNPAPAAAVRPLGAAAESAVALPRKPSGAASSRRAPSVTAAAAVAGAMNDPGLRPSRPGTRSGR